MVSSVDCTAEELPTFRICPSDEKILTSHEIPLKAGSNQSIDVLSDGYENLSSEVAAFLAPVKLILEMHSCCSILCKELG